MILSKQWRLRSFFLSLSLFLYACMCLWNGEFIWIFQFWVSMVALSDEDMIDKKNRYLTGSYYSSDEFNMEIVLGDRNSSQCIGINEVHEIVRWVEDPWIFTRMKKKTTTKKYSVRMNDEWKMIGILRQKWWKVCQRTMNSHFQKRIGRTFQFFHFMAYFISCFDFLSIIFIFPFCSFPHIAIHFHFIWMRKWIFKATITFF